MIHKNSYRNESFNLLCTLFKWRRIFILFRSIYWRFHYGLQSNRIITSLNSPIANRLLLKTFLIGWTIWSIEKRERVCLHACGMGELDIAQRELYFSFNNGIRILLSQSSAEKGPNFASIAQRKYENDKNISVENSLEIWSLLDYSGLACLRAIYVCVYVCARVHLSCLTSNGVWKAVSILPPTEIQKVLLSRDTISQMLPFRKTTEKILNTHTRNK